MKSMFALSVGWRLKNQIPNPSKILMILSKEMALAQPPLIRKDGEYMLHTHFGH